MIRRTVVLMLFALLTSLYPTLWISAQQSDRVVDDLVFPYGLSFDIDGNLWFVEGGNGDENGDVNFSASVWRLDPTGKIDRMLTMPSFSVGSNSSPLYRVYLRDDLIWVVLAGGSLGTNPPLIPFENAVVAFHKESRHIVHWIDLRGYEIAHDPDGRGEIHSNPVDIAWDAEGLLHILDAGANTLYTWTESAGLSVLTSWMNTVPTALEFAFNGDLYISFLGEALDPYAGHIEHWSNKELINTYGELTALTDILIEENGDILAVQLFTTDNSGQRLGSVVRVSLDGTVTPLIEELPYPHSIARDKDGQLYITINSASLGQSLGSGAVLRFDGR